MLVGPYSQYGWHHPGPLQYYLHAPVYFVAGSTTFSLTLAALWVNGLALAALWRGLAAVPRLSALAIAAAVSAYVWRAGDLAGSAWNAHVIVIPLMTAVVLCASGSLGRPLALAGGVVAASLAMQSSVSVGITAVVVVALTGGLALRTLAPNPAALRATLMATGVGVLLWLPPVFEQLTGQPGNVTRIWSFFATAARPTHSLFESLLIWSDALTSAWRPGFTLAWGGAYTPRGTWTLAAVAVLLVSATAFLAVRRKCDPGLSRVSAVAALGALVAMWSVTRIVGRVGSYQVFWMSGIGALLAGCLAAHVLSAVARGPAIVRFTTTALRAVIVVALAAASAGVVWRAREYALNQVAQRATRYVVAIETTRHLATIGAKRPRFHFSPLIWTHGAGIALHAYREGFEVTVDDPWIPVFGSYFAPRGREDVVLEVATRCGASGRVAARGDGLCVYEVGKPR
ncbi:hypothetical protein TBR22_A48500 [Luteitalea sp. TBR-22]|nr:hypothetical protein TBR22_A48500 [Luteitalea sp. TBR-22]